MSAVERSLLFYKMLRKFQEHINQNFSFIRDKKVLLAISGGLDSVVLFDLLKKLDTIETALAHCNFQLRGTESDADEEFVKNLYQKSSNQIFTKIFDTEKYAKENKLSTQIAARELRYHWFRELAKNHQFDYIATAHHANDNLETFFINLTRGSGLEGFTGIPEINENIIRPLLPFSRAEILVYAKENNLQWREDSSNAETKYTRNKIRHQVIPVLEEINPSLFETFSNTIRHLKESQQIVDDKIEEISADVLRPFDGVYLEQSRKAQGDKYIKIDIKKIKSLSNPKAYLYQFLKAYNFTEWNDVVDLLDVQSGKQVFSETHRLLKDRDFLILSSNVFVNDSEISEEKSFLIKESDTKITKPINLKIEKVDAVKQENKQTIFIDAAKIDFPLTLRKWQNGDVFYPNGMSGKKKVSKYFKDEKFSLLDKEQTWLLVTSTNEIVWVVNHRKDRRFQINENTKNILKLSIPH